jgi:dTDP-4-amino-4,6-dideoxygalactose transaminase
VTIKDTEQWRRPIEREMALIRELLEDGFLSGSGRGFPREFEEEFREYVGAEHCLTTSHGSTALASAFYAVGVGPGDEIITPTVGYLGSYEGALHLGARPVFCEIDSETLLIDPQDAERRITERTRAIVPIHYRGNPCDLDALMEIGRRHGVAIVEDAAHAHGAEWEGRKIGSLGDIACFSMQGANPSGKPVAGGEGGIVTTNNRELYERQLIYCHLHRTGIKEELTNPVYRMFESEVLGRKWRAHPLALAVAKASLDTLEYRIERSAENRAKVFDALRELPGLDPAHSYPQAKRVQLYGGLMIIYHPEELHGLPAGRFVEAVEAEGAPVRGPGFRRLQHLKPLSRRGFDLWGHDRGPLGGEFLGLPPYEVYKEGDFPRSEDLHGRVFNIPSYIEPKEGFLDQFIGAFEKVTSNYKSLL